MNTEILEGNKLIAKFMGYSKIEDTSNLTCDTKELWIENKNAEPNKRILQGLPNYHSSWDWLIPSWGKLSSLLLDISAFELIDEFKNAVLKNDIYLAWGVIIKGVKIING